MSRCAGRSGSPGQVVVETVVLPQFLLVEKIFVSFEVVDIPVMAQSLIPVAFLFSRPQRFPCCRTHSGRCPSRASRARFTGAGYGGDSRAPTAAARGDNRRYLTSSFSLS